MEWVETTGRTIAEAKDAALDQLGVDEHDAEFEILAEPKSGLFGRLREEARVRARVRPTRPRAKEDRGRRGRPRGDGGRAARSAGAGHTGTADGSTDARPGQDLPATGSGLAESAPPSGGGAEGTDPSRSRRPRSRGRRGRGSSVTGEPGDGSAGDRPNGGAAAATGATSGRTESSRQTGEDDRAMSEDVPMEEQAEVARRFLLGLLEQFDAPGSRVDVRPIDEETVELAVTGEDLGLLIGPKGATLQAVQELTRTVVQRQTGGHNGRLFVDVAGYREKRKAALERFAREVAGEVLASGTRRVLEPMQPADRKVLHDVINTIEGVSTTSEGEEPRRRVVILPSS